MTGNPAQMTIRRPGDAVWFAPGERHWHGAADHAPFGYVSIQAMKDGRFVEWFGPVEKTP